MGVTLTLAAIATYWLVSSHLTDQVNAQLQADIRVAVSLSPNGTFDQGLASRVVSRFRGDLLQVVSPGGLYYSSGARASPQGSGLPITPSDEAIANTGQGRNAEARTTTVSGVTYRVETVGGILQTPDGTPLALQVAHPITDIERTLDQLRLVLGIVTLSGIVAAIGLGYLVALATIRPVKRLTAAAEHVAATEDLEASVDDDGQDELGRLGQAFNAMLGSLRASRQQQAQLVTDAGHELRTPLTSLRTNVEVLLKYPELPAEDRSGLLGDVQAQVDELTSLVGDLVELGRHDEQRREPIEVEFRNIVERAVERVRRRAVGARFAVDLDSGVVLAQPDLLERAIVNVLDNAVKFSPPGAPIEISLRRQNLWLLDVADRGPGIGIDHLPKVFDRFYRAPTARGLPGSGLGLAIVAQVIGQHHGNVQVSQRAEGGTIVHIELPMVSEIEPD